MKNQNYHPDMPIINLPLSRKTKLLIQEMGFYKIKDLYNENYFSIKDKFTDIYNIGTIIKELNRFGFLIAPDNEIFLYNTNISKRLLNILARYDIFYLSELINTPKEHLKRFRGLGEKSFLELEVVCSSYGVELKTLQPMKEKFSKIGIKDSRYYNIFFRNNILEVADLLHISLEDLYTMCGYRLTMKLYYILVGHKLYPSNSNVYFIFQVLSAYQSRQLYRVYKIEKIEQLINFHKSDLLILRGIGKASVNKLAAILASNNLSFKNELE